MWPKRAPYGVVEGSNTGTEIEGAPVVTENGEGWAAQSKWNIDVPEVDAEKTKNHPSGNTGAEQ